MTRVLFVIHFPVFGGPHNQALRLAGPLRAHGVDTLVLLPQEPGSAAERLRMGGVDVVTLPLHRLRASANPRLHLGLAAGFLPEVGEIRQLIRERGIDIVQVGGLVNPHAAIAARLESVPVVWQLLDTRAPRPVALAAMTLVREFANVVMSTGSRVALWHPGGVSLRDRLVPFFPPVDTDLFRPRPDEKALIRESWGIPVSAPVVGCVANVNPQKGTVELVRALATIRNAIRDTRLVLVGAEYHTHAAYSAAVRAEMARGGLVEGRDVLFTGERHDVEHQLAGFDVFAFTPTPHSEGISTAVLEAMAAGLPVVTASVAGLQDAIQDGGSGFLVPPLDQVALAHRIVQLLRDPILAVRLGKAARERAVSRFSVERCVEDHLHAYDVARGRRSRPLAMDGGAAIEKVADRLACPLCRSPLAADAYGFLCAACDRIYPVVDGIPVLMPDLASSDHDEVEHLHGSHDDGPGEDTHKAAQAQHFDRAVAEEFEITRPHGTPRLYRFLLHEKFRRATAPIGPHLVGATALTVCGGSGMDAEVLARAGARVVATDISLGAARRARERARRYGLDITPIVADVERLPFADASIDLVLVHDGLHHLERPEAGLAEMARVARRWVSVTEPTRAAATAIAVKAGLALDQEEAGNQVARVTPTGIVNVLRAAGFRPLVAERYAMYYHHQPGRVFRLLSCRGIFPFVRAAWRVANAAIGRFGNKLAVVAERTPND